MSDKNVRFMILMTSCLLLVIGAVLFFVFDRQGLGNHKTNNYVDYNVNNYVEITPVIFSNYDDVYSNINVSKVEIKNIDESITKVFTTREAEIISYITGYYNEIRVKDYYVPINNVSSSVKSQINGAILSVFYRVDFNLDENIFADNSKSYMIAINIDLGTNKVLTNDDLLSKYNYTKNYIAEKLFNEVVLIEKNQVAIDKDTNISLTKSDIERKKEEYVNRIVSEFDNIIEMYIEENSLVLVYDAKELKSIFFDNQFDTEIKIRYLK